VRGVKSTLTKGEIIPIETPEKRANPAISAAVRRRRPR
jgi:hypothetical protein